MSRMPPLPRLPLALLGLLTLACFGGPFALFLVVRGGPERRLAPRPPRRVDRHRRGARNGPRAVRRVRHRRLVVPLAESRQADRPAVGTRDRLGDRESGSLNLESFILNIQIDGQYAERSRRTSSLGHHRRIFAK